MYVNIWTDNATKTKTFSLLLFCVYFYMVCLIVVILYLCCYFEVKKYTDYQLFRFTAFC